MGTLDLASLRRIVQVALGEDVARGDVTSDRLFKVDRMVEADITVKQVARIAGLSVVAAVFSEVDALVHWTPLVREGEDVSSQTVVGHLSGSARSILKGERVALNFLGHLSGVATLTSQFVAETEGTQAKIYDTRKTLPGLRVLEKYAVTVGGGMNHRVDLSDGILVKDNHLLAVGEIASAISLAQAAGRGDLPIEVEVSTLEEAEEALLAGADILLLDNMSLEQLQSAAAFVRRWNEREQAAGREKYVSTEVSGGVTLAQVADIAATGVDRISVGQLTHSAPSVDFSLKVKQ